MLESMPLIERGKRLDSNRDASGLMLWLGRMPGPSLVANSRIREITRQPQSAGTEVPVVRESDFRFDSILLLNVPYDAGSRAALRVWALGNPEGWCYVSAYSYADSFPGFTLPLQRSAPDAPWFGSVDVTSSLRQLKQGHTTTVRIRPRWRGSRHAHLGDDQRHEQRDAAGHNHFPAVINCAVWPPDAPAIDAVGSQRTRLDVTNSYASFNTSESSSRVSFDSRTSIAG